jgi:hypothetical protein
VQLEQLAFYVQNERAGVRLPEGDASVDAD